MVSNTSHTTLTIIRSKLSCFISRRERAYRAVVTGGHPVPDYAAKIRAINMLRNQLQASTAWDLQSNLRWIHAMRHLVTELLPYEFHDDPKQKVYRKHMVDLLNYCEDLLDSKPLFHSKPTAV